MSQAVLDANDGRQCQGGMAASTGCDISHNGSDGKMNILIAARFYLPKAVLNRPSSW